MYKNMARGFAVVVAGAVLSAAGISGISTPGSAATSRPVARALSARVSQRPPVRGAQLWVKLYSGPRTTDSLPSSVAVSPGGGTVFVTGTTARAGSGTGRGSFATVAYKAATGARLWARPYRGPGNGFDQATSMAVSGGKVFVTGSSATSDGGFGSYATIAYNAATGARLWARSYGARGSDDAAASVAVSPRGGRVFVTGCTDGFSSGDVDYATVAYDAATGRRLWARSYDGGGNSGGCATSVAVGPGGGRVFVIGSIDNNYATVAYNAATGAQLWARPFPGLRDPEDPIGTVFVAVSGGSVFVTGTSFGAMHAIDYGTVAYSAATGAQLWAKRYSNGRGSSLSTPRSMAVSGGKVFVTGTNFAAGSPVSEYATVAYSAATGAQLWVRRYRGRGSFGNDASSVAVSPTGRTVYVTGTSATYRNGTGDYATVAYNAVTGARLWVRGYYHGHGCYFGNDASSVAVSPRGGQVFVTGTRYAPATCAYYPASSYATIAYRG